MTKSEYEKYLKSAHWLKTRKAKLASCNYRCEKCSGSCKLEVHHRTYANLGAERLKDLQVLCEVCHKWVHFPMSRIESELDKWHSDFKQGKG